MLHEVIVSASDRRRISAISREFCNGFLGFAEADLARAARRWAEQLPKRVRCRLIEFTEADDSAGLLFRCVGGLDDFCGDTPSDPIQPRVISNPAQAFVAMMMALTGRLVAYEGQQNARIFNDIVPLGEFAKVPNSSSGSKEDFDFHTEDAYHQFPPDYLGLFCVRNIEQAQTVVSWVTRGKMPENVFEVLRGREISNLPNQGSIVNETLAEPRPIVFGHSAQPYIQVNFARLRASSDPAVSSAIAWLREDIASNAVDVVLGPNDFLLLDNLRAVHGRRRFKSLSGGTRRWLIRALSLVDARRATRRNFHSEYPYTL